MQAIEIDGVVRVFRRGVELPMHTDKDGYKYVLAGVYVHRLMFEQTHGSIPPGYMVDHQNGKQYDNRLPNLRLATRAQNAMNSGVRVNNKLGIKGLSRSFGKLAAQVDVGKTRRRARFPDTAAGFAEAKLWLTRTRQELHGEFAKD